ncbi:MAG: hypothetical protein Kilf2KO_05570 [Rhodospirillales bacterium]
MGLQPRDLAKAVATALLATGLALPASAETLNLTIASSHPTTIPWVGAMADLYVGEANERLEAAGSTTRIDWTEAYGGSLYGFKDTLEAVEQGLTDVGWVGAFWEGSKMPLHGVTYNAPFATDDMLVMLDVVNSMHDEIPALNEAWEDNNQVFLGASGVDTYHLMTNFPVTSLADLEGRKILAPGASAAWLKGTGAVALDGGLTTYYTDIQTGKADGVLTILSGAYPFKLHEVAPYITLVGIGAQATGGVSVNLDTWEDMDPEVQTILAELGREYSVRHAEEVNARVEAFKEKMVAEGATISTLPADERQRWIDGLPDLGGEWAKTQDDKGLPGSEVLKAYLEGIRARGGAPARNWGS